MPVGATSYRLDTCIFCDFWAWSSISSFCIFTTHILPRLGFALLKMSIQIYTIEQKGTGDESLFQKWKHFTIRPKKSKK